MTAAATRTQEAFAAARAVTGSADVGTVVGSRPARSGDFLCYFLSSLKESSSTNFAGNDNRKKSKSQYVNRKIFSRAARQEKPCAGRIKFFQAVINSIHKEKFL